MEIGRELTSIAGEYQSNQVNKLMRELKTLSKFAYLINSTIDKFSHSGQPPGASTIRSLVLTLR